MVEPTVVENLDTKSYIITELISRLVQHALAMMKLPLALITLLSQPRKETMVIAVVYYMKRSKKHDPGHHQRSLVQHVVLELHPGS
jgi:hypothetical protein